jgi:hypothetical protein
MRARYDEYGAHIEHCRRSPKAERPARKVVERWQASGNARICMGGRTTAALASW